MVLRGEWDSGLGADFLGDWILERRSRLARCMYIQLAADGRFAVRVTLNEVRFRPSSTLSYGGFPACLLAFGLNQLDLYMWRDDGSGFEFSRDASFPGRFAQQWKQWIIAEEAPHTGGSE